MSLFPEISIILHSNYIKKVNLVFPVRYKHNGIFKATGEVSHSSCTKALFYAAVVGRQLTVSSQHHTDALPIRMSWE